VAEAEEAEGAFGAARATLGRASAGDAAGDAALAHARAEEPQAREGEEEKAARRAMNGYALVNEDLLRLRRAVRPPQESGEEEESAEEQAARPATATRPLTSTSTRPATATGVGRCDEAQSRGASPGRGALSGSSGVFGGFSPIFPTERSPGCDWRSGDWPAAGPAGSRAFPKVSGQRRPLSSRTRAERTMGSGWRADSASLSPYCGAAEGAVGLNGYTPPAPRPQFAVDYQPKLSSTSPKHATGISLLAGGGATWSSAAPW